MAEEDKDSKTEEPTEKRLSKARDEGDVPMSQEIRNLFALGGVIVIVGLMGPWLITSIGHRLSLNLQQLHSVDIAADGFRGFIVDLLLDVSIFLAGPVGIFVVLAFASSYFQVGFLWTPKKLTPKLSQLNPISGVKRIFSKNALVELGKSLVKVFGLGAVAAIIMIPLLPPADFIMGLSLPEIMDLIHWLVVLMLIVVTAGMFVLAMLDLIWQRMQHNEKLKMSKQEVKDERKDMEGDPKIKGRIMALRIQRHKERMMSMVPRASVVVTNPTHYAVALLYEMDEMPAPKLVAKGVDFLALKIREVAEENEVPIVENPPLARALYASVELDQEIPPQHYKAVAEVIGYVFRLKGALG